VAVAAFLLLIGGLWITGILPRMLGERPPPKVTGPVYVKSRKSSRISTSPMARTPM
ncbi:unnamed protein product, partial [Acidocella sp. C78]